jgi:membrane associated rhomboid family serine protease
MGLENRDYYRERDYTSALGGWGLDYISPVVKWLIIANVAVFLAQIFIVRPMTLEDWKVQIEEFPPSVREPMLEAMDEAKKRRESSDGDSGGEFTQDEPLPEEFSEEMLFAGQKISIAEEWLQLDTRKVLRGQVWRIVTYSFCHDRNGVWHILFNMLGLFWFGVTLESMYGQREFLLFYLTGAVISGLAVVGINLWTGSYVPTIGASGAVMAVLMLYAIHYPRSTIRIFWFFPIEVRWLVVLYVIWDLHPLLLQLAGDQVFTGIAHAGHLGGLAFGFLYWKFDLQLERWLSKLPIKMPAPARRPPRETIPIRRSLERELEDETDAILKKIHESGEASLTDAERRTLQRASERAKRRRE